MSQPDQTWDPNLYQSAHAFVWQKAADLLELLAPKSGERILDLGSGTGQLAAKIAEAGAEVIGIDRSPEMVEQARRNFSKMRFEVGDATTFSVDEPVGAVFSNATLHWVKPPEAAVGRVWHALQPGGRFVAEFGGKGNVGRIMDALRVALRDVAGVDFDALNPWYYPSIAEYAALLERQGFSVTFATLFERPTPLEGGAEGLRNWVRMFGASLLDRVEAGKRDAVLARVEEHARPALFGNGSWSADYVREWVIRAARISRKCRPKRNSYGSLRQACANRTSTT
jgi:trans-aconitate 2-methyltransferase